MNLIMLEDIIVNLEYVEYIDFDYEENTASVKMNSNSLVNLNKNQTKILKEHMRNCVYVAMRKANEENLSRL